MAANSSLDSLLAAGSLGHQTKMRFLLVGIWNTIFGYLAFVGLNYLASQFIFQKNYVAYMFAAVISNILAIINAYLFHKYVTFRSDVRSKEIIQEFFRFASTYLFTIFLALTLLPIIVEVIQIEPKIAGGILVPITTVISYFGHSRFSFRRRALSGIVPAP